jgi:hypothetical protein
MDQPETAVIGSLVLMVIFGVVGYILKLIIWDSKKQTANAVEQGKKIASHAIFYATLTSAFFFKAHWVTGGDYYYNPRGIYFEAFFRTATSITIWTLIGFGCGYLYWKIVKEKNWKPALYALIAIIAIALFKMNGDIDLDEVEDEHMYFSMKFALLYAIAGFVAYSYYLKEGENAKIVALGGLALCVVFTLLKYGFSYAILTAIEYAVGCGLAHMYSAQKNTEK